MKSILELVEEAVNGTLNERIVVMKLSLILLNQTFVAVPTSVTVADFAAFYITSLVFVSFFFFGCFINSKIDRYTVLEDYFQSLKGIPISDPYAFVFSLKSNGRLQYPMKFEIINVEKGGYTLHDENSEFLIQLSGNIILMKENQSQLSWCIQEDWEYFNYHRIQHALCGKSSKKQRVEVNDSCFTPIRIRVIQMI